MVQVCPACNAENRDIAKFCDQCAAPLAADAVVIAAPSTTAATGSPAPARQMAPFNWTGLLVVAAIVLGIVYVVRMPSTNDKPQLGMAGSGSAGASDNPMDTMQGVQKQLKDFKDKLAGRAKDAKSLDAKIDVIKQMYAMYAQIGQLEKMHPYVEQVADEILQLLKAGKLLKDDATKQLAALALDGLQSSDEEGGLLALRRYHDADPENLGVMLTIANVSYDLGKTDEAVQWYGMYLAKATPATQGKDYWNARVDRDSMYIALAQQGDKAQFATAISDLNEVIKAQPKHWGAWHNLGEAYRYSGDTKQAGATYHKAIELADTEYHRWRSEAALAEMEGREVPPQPDPHAGMDMGGMMDTPPPGTPNPHSAAPDAQGGI